MFCIVHDGQVFQEAPCSNPEAWLVMTPLELAQHSPFYLSIEQAVQISGALLLACAAAFVIRMARKLLEDQPERD
ncbi:hypothetical protein [Comamonas aquatica]|uniref:hypothetical protein n=1 Tax=Comamonas aquatica TaxID=225991 RepID=UPI002448F187|nr:hypothetical protein [Comamonas aquatica]MDH1903714.1 hypothetical protein [Comamonas aquatica]